MSTSYHLTEAFPNVPSHLHVGRGGAGNVARRRSNVATSPNRSSWSSPPNTIFSSDPLLANYVYPPPPSMTRSRQSSLSSLLSSSHRSSSSLSRSSRRRKTYPSGRSGWGNLHPASERAMFSFDEELERLDRAHEDIAPVYHIGRGGYGNQCFSGADEEVAPPLMDGSEGGDTSSDSRGSSVDSLEREQLGAGFVKWMKRRVQRRDRGVWF